MPSYILCMYMVSDIQWCPSEFLVQTAAKCWIHSHIVSMNLCSKLEGMRIGSKYPKEDDILIVVKYFSSRMFENHSLVRTENYTRLVNFAAKFLPPQYYCCQDLQLLTIHFHRIPTKRNAFMDVKF